MTKGLYITEFDLITAKNVKIKERNQDSLAQLKLLDDITTTPNNIGGDAFKIENVPSEDIPDTNYVGRSRELLLHMEKYPEEWQKILSDMRLVMFIDKENEINKKANYTKLLQECIHKLRIIQLYINIIGNETERLMIIIDMIESVAKQLLGLERTKIFFDILKFDLYFFGSAGTISDFLPNMAVSAVRQHVVSFFEYASDRMNRLMILLLSCPDSKLLQKVTEQNFISIMESVIDTSLKTNFQGGKRISLKGSTFVMVDSEEFERALGEEIHQDILDRLRHGEEMVALKFVDTKLERTQASERRENRPIHSIYFPSDCRLFIYLPTEEGSYWHQLDMQRASRINNCSNSSNYNPMVIKCSHWSYIMNVPGFCAAGKLKKSWDKL